MKKYYLAKRLNLQGLVEWMNDNFRKENGREFNRNDINAYVRRGYLPKRLGEIYIEKIETKYCTVKLYNLITEDPELGGMMNEDEL